MRNTNGIRKRGKEMFCGKCGHEVKDGAKFCQNCGAPVTIVEENIVSGGIEKNIAAEKKVREKKSDRIKKVLISVGCLIALVVVAIVGINVYDCFFANQKLAAVENENGKWGYINEEGELVIECEYDRVGENWIDGVVWVGKKVGIDEEGNEKMKFGLINKRGKVVVPFQYDDVSNYKFGELFAVRKESGELDEDGDEILKLGFINSRGKQVTEIKYLYARPLSFESENDLIIVTERTEGDDVYNSGIMNSKGDIVIPFDYQDIWSQTKTMGEDGLICVGKGGNGEYKYGYINYDNKEVIPIQYDIGGTFADNGLAVVCKNEKWGYIDKKGNTVIDFQYNNAYTFAENGIARVEETDGTYSYIDATGTVIKSGAWTDTYDFDENGLTQIQIGDEWGLFNADWEKIIPCEYTSIINLSEGMYSVGIIGEDGRYEQLADCKGRILDKKFDYLSSEFGVNSWIPAGTEIGVNEDGMREFSWRYVDKKGETMLDLPDEYRWVEPFRETNPK